MEAILWLEPDNGSPICCKAWIEARGPYEAIVLTDESVSKGDLVWLEDQQSARLHVVKRVFQAGDQVRLELQAAHSDRQKLTRREEDREAHVRRRHGAESEETSGRVLDVSAGGMQILLPHDLPMGAEVQITFGDREQTGEVRWVERAGDSFRVGVQFKRERAALESNDEAASRQTAKTSRLAIPSYMEGVDALENPDTDC